jgi:hypothetical protein
MKNRSHLCLAASLAGALLATAPAYAASDHQAHGCTAMAHSSGTSVYTLRTKIHPVFTIHEDFPNLSAKVAYAKSYRGLARAGQPVTKQDDLMMLTVDIEFSKYVVTFEPNGTSGVTVKGRLENVFGGEEIEETLCKAFLPLEEK